MGLTTSREAIERQADPATNEAEGADFDKFNDGEDDNKAIQSSNRKKRSSVSRGLPTPTSPPATVAQSSKRRSSEANQPKKKKKKPKQTPTQDPGSMKTTHHSTPRRPETTQSKKKRSSKSTPLKSKGSTPASRKSPAATTHPPSSQGGEQQSLGHVEEIAAEEPNVVASPPPMNAHKFKIMTGKQAVAAIREGTRIYIKSGEGNGGDTWWDSGVVQKVHERGRRFEVDWEGINNRGEEVETGGEKRIDLPVTYSLGGAAAAAIQSVPPGTQEAALVRKQVLADARIGSWCIQHPEEPWGMLDPFGEDSI